MLLSTGPSVSKGPSKAFLTGPPAATSFVRRSDGRRSPPPGQAPHKPHCGPRPETFLRGHSTPYHGTSARQPAAFPTGDRRSVTGDPCSRPVDRDGIKGSSMRNDPALYGHRAPRSSVPRAACPNLLPHFLSSSVSPPTLPAFRFSPCGIVRAPCILLTGGRRPTLRPRSGDFR